jgi:hypothetical protein
VWVRNVHASKCIFYYRMQNIKAAHPMMKSSKTFGLSWQSSPWSRRRTSSVNKLNTTHQYLYTLLLLFHWLPPLIYHLKSCNNNQ